MRVGIYTRYQRRDSTYAMLELADNLANVRVADVTILTPTPNRPTLSTEWDHRVLSTSKWPVDRWMQSCDLLVFEYPPEHMLDLFPSIHERKIVTVLVYQWDEDAIYSRDLLAKHTCVFAPCYAATRVLREKYDLINPYCLHWTPPAPRQRHSTPPGQIVKAFVPLGSCQPRQSDLRMVQMLAKLPYEQMAVTISHNGLSGDALSALERLQRQVPQGRMTFVRHNNRIQRTLSMGAHDVTLIMSLHETFGLQATDSLRMGTPVVAFDVAPLSDLITSTDGVLVASDLEQPCIVVPHVQPNIDNYVRSVRNLVSSGHLAKLQETCGKSLAIREKAFHERWRSVIQDVR